MAQPPDSHPDKTPLDALPTEIQDRLLTEVLRFYHATGVPVDAILQFLIHVLPILEDHHHGRFDPAYTQTQERDDARARDVFFEFWEDDGKGRFGAGKKQKH